MSRESIPVVECDRCRLRVEIREVGQDRGWGHAWASAPHPDPDKPGRRWLSSETGQADICPACSDELFAWWLSPPADRASPPPQPQQQPTRVKVTQTQRQALVARVADELMEQVTASILAVKDEPSSILSADIIPAAFDGIEIRARRLVKGLIEGLK